MERVRDFRVGKKVDEQRVGKVFTFAKLAMRLFTEVIRRMHSLQPKNRRPVLLHLFLPLFITLRQQQ
jgi:hypothetical protein